jgi:hypothetical protein
MFLNSSCDGERAREERSVKVYTPGERTKLGLLCILLFLLLGMLAFTAANTVQAVRNFQQQQNAVKAGDVKAIHPWMTVHVISHIYHVPENYLYNSLQIDNPVPLRHETLYEIASHKRLPVDQVIHLIQHAILAYRKVHPIIRPTPTSTPTPQPKTRRLSSKPGRTKY